MKNIVSDFLKKYEIKDATIVVGFSTGPDSCALACLLNELKQEFNLKIVLAYFNHGWRKEAQDEEKFCAQFAKEKNIDYEIGKINPNAPKTEENARIERYEYFNQISKKYNSSYVFLAHNKNDNVETLIYRIIKGTSIKGLTSIPEKRDIFYRPLLLVEKSEILSYLEKINQKYMIDSSNDDTKYKRNLIRKEILPLFNKINPKYVNSINNLILGAIEQRKIIEKEIKRIEEEIFVGDKIDYYKYIELDFEIRLEILNNFIGKYLKYRDRKNLIKYDDFILNNLHSKTSLNKELFLRTRWKKIFIEKG